MNETRMYSGLNWVNVSFLKYENTWTGSEEQPCSRVGLLCRIEDDPQDSHS